VALTNLLSLRKRKADGDILGPLHEPFGGESGVVASIPLTSHRQWCFWGGHGCFRGWYSGRTPFQRIFAGVFELYRVKVNRSGNSYLNGNSDVCPTIAFPVKMVKADCAIYVSALLTFDGSDNILRKSINDSEETVLHIRHTFPQERCMLRRLSLTACSQYLQWSHPRPLEVLV
jgi:hypothetical protein